jgi:hypothetical protein
VLRVRQALQQRWPVAQMHELLRSFSDADLALLLNLIKGAQQQHQQQQQQVQGLGSGGAMLPVNAGMAAASGPLAVSAAGPPPLAAQLQQQGGGLPAASAPPMGAAAVNSLLGDMLAGGAPPAAAGAAAASGGGPNNQSLMELLMQLSSVSSEGPPVGALDSFGGNLAPLPDLVADLPQLPSDGTHHFMDWIPDLDKVESNQVHQQQQQQQQAAGSRPPLGTKRERSTTAAGGARQNPAQQQQQQLQQAPPLGGLRELLGGPSFFGDDLPDDILSLRDSSSGSFGRHLPTARLRSTIQDVTQVGDWCTVPGVMGDVHGDVWGYIQLLGSSVAFHSKQCLHPAAVTPVLHLIHQPCLIPGHGVQSSAPSGTACLGSTPASCYTTCYRPQHMWFVVDMP